MTIVGFSSVWFVATDNRENKKELFQGSFEVLSYLGKGFIFCPFCNRENAIIIPEYWAKSVSSSHP